MKKLKVKTNYGINGMIGVYDEGLGVQICRMINEYTEVHQEEKRVELLIAIIKKSKEFAKDVHCEEEMNSILNHSTLNIGDLKNLIEAVIANSYRSMFKYHGWAWNPKNNTK